MDKITVKLIEDKREWEDFLEKHTEVNFLQSWYWGEFHRALGKSIFRTGFYTNKKLIGVMLSIVEPARRGRYLTVPGGPIIDWKNQLLVKAIFMQVKMIAKNEKCVFVRIRPQLIQNDFSKKIFRENNCHTAPMYLHAELTSQLDITKSEEELLLQMRKTTRYEIRKAERLGITIATTKDERQIQSFYDLQLDTAKRQQFIPFSFQFFQEQFKVFLVANQALLYTASFEKKVLAQAFIIFYGNEAVYHYGASTEEGRK